MARNQDDSHEESLESLVELAKRGNNEELKALVERIKAGDLLAFSELIERAKTRDAAAFDALTKRAKEGDDFALDALFECARSKPHGAFEVLVERYSPEIWRFIRKSVQDGNNDVDDLTQETFIKAWLKLSKLTENSSFRSWLYKIAYHVVIDDLRKRGKNPPRSIDQARNWSDKGDENTNPEASVIEKENKEEITRRVDEITRRVLESLPQNCQECYRLYKDEFPNDEIANTLHILSSSVGAYISKAKKAVRDALKQEFGKAVREPLKQVSENDRKGDESNG